MPQETTFSCVLVGGQTLLLQCAQELLQREHQIQAIVSDDSAVRSWARNAGIEILDSDDTLETRLGTLQFDYLFSIVNLKISPDFMLAAPGQCAINFHDGLLPDYAGLNVTTWALLNGAREHGVTWHEMLHEVDTGKIFLEQRFDVEPEDTALALNARCFEAGFASFQTLISNIEKGELEGHKQAAREARFFAGSKKPEALGLIDWSAGADAVARLIRALDFGGYPNPVTAAKSLFNSQVLILHNARSTQHPSGQPPGTVVAVTNSEVVISTSTNDLSVDLPVTVDGSPSPLLAPGNQFDSRPAEEQLERARKVAQKHESFWLRRFSRLPDLALAQVQPPTTADFSLNQYESLGDDSADLHADLAVLAAFVARQSGLDLAAIPILAVSDSPLLATTVPLRVDLGAHRRASFEKQFARELEKIDQHATYSKDLFFRHPAVADKAGAWAGGCHGIALAYLRKGASLPATLPAAIMLVADENKQQIQWWFQTATIARQTVDQLRDQHRAFAEDITVNKQPVARGSILSKADASLLAQWNATELSCDNSVCVHQLFERQAQTTPDAEAASYLDRSLSYQELNQRSNQIAHYLIGVGVRPSDRVGILMDRSELMLAAMLATMKAGAAYVPLDPDYPADRIRYMIEDSAVSVVLADHAEADAGNAMVIDPKAANLAQRPDSNPQVKVAASDLAYVIYTSGSTGQPKGVMVEHRNVVNFFHGMDGRVEPSDPGVWLAVTSISFDISVLELFWTLCRGFKVVIQPSQQAPATAGRSRYADRKIGFSLFFWNYVNDADRDSPDKYGLLMDAARFADDNGFEAIWTPERHFGDFGGSYPNPSVISAALAATTSNVKIRAGSVVMPLHSPIRVAEDWSIVDNLSGGRVGLSFASGWQPNDFVIKPEGFENSKKVMLDGIDVVRKLWRGEEVSFDGPKGAVNVRTLPRPIQPELPIWVTSAGSEETFRAAGTMGANLLTHLLGQTVAKVGENLKVYREAWTAAGHAGNGHVTMMLHTLVGTDEQAIRETAREPMKRYLKSAMFLVKAAAWEFPTFKKMSADTGRELDDLFAEISDEDMDGLLEFAFERYFQSSGLFGTPESCMAMVDSLKEIGVDEIGCLVDYGLTNKDVLSHLPNLATLNENANFKDKSIAEDYLLLDRQIKRNKVTHFQCTPSQASMLVADADTHDAISDLQHFMIGGEALSSDLAAQVRTICGGRVTNMYGPTETTIWSTTWDLPQNPESISIGSPVANTSIHIVDEALRPLPVGSVGELVIGGEGVVRGYHNQEELSRSRFPENVLGCARVYRTGDRALFLPDGTLQCLGRMDSQVKVRGHRIELGEIESALCKNHDILAAAVVLREDQPGDQQLCGYFVTNAQKSLEEAAVRHYLQTMLPDFMVPARLMQLERMPLTPNGKIDRRSLPAVRNARADQKPAKPPQEGLESDIAAIWCNLLDRDEVGIEQNFFEIGGHSLLAVKLQAELGELLGRKIPITDIFRFPTVESFAASCTTERQPTETRGRSRAARRLAARDRR